MKDRVRKVYETKGDQLITDALYLELYKEYIDISHLCKLISFHQLFKE